MSSDRQLGPLVIAALAATAGGALVLLGVFVDVGAVAVAVVIAVGAMVPVRVPWGGSVPMAGAAVIAAVALLSHADAAASVGVGVVVAAVVFVLVLSRAEAIAAIERFFLGAVAAVGAGVALDVVVVGEVPTLAAALGASAGLVVADLVVVRFMPGSHRRIEIRAAIPVHLTLACAGILIAVAVDQVGVAMAAVAAFPLLITRFSFERYAGATDTLEQTVQALGLVPELAGLAPLGHSERSAAYALALARELDFDRASTTRIVTATRLHHLGAVPTESDDELAPDLAPGAIAEHGARIIREAGMATDVADLLASANADRLDAVAPSLEAAVVRAAATFDEIVGDDVDAADRGLSIVTGAARDPYSRRAAAALLEFVASGDGLVRDAVAAGDRFREAAVGLDLEAITGNRAGSGDLLPFARRA